MRSHSYGSKGRVLIRPGVRPVRVELRVEDGKDVLVAFRRHAPVVRVVGGFLVIDCSPQHYGNVSVKHTGSAYAVGEGSQAVSGISFGNDRIDPTLYTLRLAEDTCLARPAKWRLGIGVETIIVTVPHGTRYAVA